MKRITTNFRGHVQGVGFRYTVCDLAKPIDVTGYVKNLGDGSVELVAEGSEDALEKLLAQILEKMAANIHEHTIDESPGTGEYDAFDIAH